MEEVKFAPASVLVNYNNNRKLRLWCSAIGTVEFDSVNSDRQIICYTERNGNRMPIVFNEYGELYSEYDDDLECCLFPCRTCKDWRQWRLVMIQEGDIVVNVQTDKVYMVMTAKVSEDPNLTTYKLVDSESNVLEEAEVNAIIPLLRFATKQEIRMYYEEVRIYTIAKKTDRTIIVNLFAGPGAGKCFAKGTKVLMWNGTVKNIEDIVVNDLVMGDDSTPRKVLELHHGNAQMYKLHRGHSKDIIVSANHILSLMRYHVNKTWSYEDISIEDYFNASKKHKHYSRLYKKEINYPENNIELKIDPYYLGYWLGDGISDQINRFCTTDHEIIEYCQNYAKQLGLVLKQHSYKEGCCQTYCLTEGNIGNHSNHPLKGNLYNLIKNKHIPLEYKTANIETRLQLIAGLIDSDGGKSRNSYDWINKNYQLAYDFYCLVNSCGLRATMKESKKTCNNFTGTYYRISITGDLSKIPVKIERKKFRDNIKDTTKVLRECFTVESIGNSEYYGFTTDGNRRFVLDDCTVVHNSTGAAYIFSMLKMNGFRCEYVSEFAKDKVWEENNTALNCQFYVAGKQIYKVSRVIGKVNIVITDSPILLSAYYSKDNSLKNAILYEHNKYENLNIFIERDKAYDEVGRLQNYDEACKIDNDLKDMLNSYNQEYVSIKGNKDGYDKIVDMITKKWDDKYKPTKNKM